MSGLAKQLGEAADTLNIALGQAEEVLRAKWHKVEAAWEIREGVHLMFVGGHLGIQTSEGIKPLTSAKLDDRVLAAENLGNLEQALVDASCTRLDEVKIATERALQFAARIRCAPRTRE
jgi:hypothetical protein